MLRSDVGRDFGFGLDAAGPDVEAGLGFRDQRERELRLELELAGEADLDSLELGALVEVEVEVERGRESVLRAGEEVRLVCRDRLLRRGRGSSRSRRGTTIFASSFVTLMTEKKM
jgi:hypothetical protein